MFGLDPAALLKKISQVRTPGSSYLAHGVPPDRARMITSMDFPGIGTLPEYRRDYPNDRWRRASSGFVNATAKGAAGLE